jgi:hypothetical protein
MMMTVNYGKINVSDEEGWNCIVRRLLRLSAVQSLAKWPIF